MLFNDNLFDNEWTEWNCQILFYKLRKSYIGSYKPRAHITLEIRCYTYFCFPRSYKIVYLVIFRDSLNVFCFPEIFPNIKVASVIMKTLLFFE